MCNLSAVSCLSEIIGAYIVPAYSSMGLVTVLYVFVKVSLFLPQWVEVRAFSILIVIEYDELSLLGSIAIYFKHNFH